MRQRAVSDNVAVIEAAGGIDAYSVPELRATAMKALSTGHSRLAFDLTGIDFIAQAGVGVMVGAMKRATAAGGTVVIVTSWNPIIRILYVTGLHLAFHVFDTTDEAVEFLLTEPLPARTPIEGYRDGGKSGWHWIRARAFLPDAFALAAADQAIREAAFYCGMRVAVAVPRQRSSPLAEFLVRARDHDGQPTCGQALARLERDIIERLAAPDPGADPLAEGEKPEGEEPAPAQPGTSLAAAALVAALADAPEAVIQVGSVLLAKAYGTTVARNLPDEELAKWKEDAQLFSDPGRAVRELQRAAV